ncbi:MAG: SDR family oxidoreductase [Synergistes sp.]|nr:SDR family oxidoreductase [Synergistes sp.]
MGFKSFVKHSISFVCSAFKEKKIIPIPKFIDTNSLLIGRVALITGGSSGIGYAIAEAFLRNGCKVIIAGTKEDKLQRCVTKLGENAKYIVIDVKNVKLIPQKVASAATLFSEGFIDILVNSAGLVTQHAFWELDEQEYDDIMDTNMKGTYFMSKYVALHMRHKKKNGNIVNVASSSSVRPAWTPYQISKWGVRGFTLGLAETLLPYGIVVNCVAPGPTATPMLNKHDGDSIYNASSPAGRYSMPEEIANLVTFMVSDLGRMIIGDTVFMTGGSGNLTLHG